MEGFREGECKDGVLKWRQEGGSCGGCVLRRRFEKGGEKGRG